MLLSEGFSGRFLYQIISEVAFPMIMKFSKWLVCRSEDLRSPCNLLSGPAALDIILEKNELLIFKNYFLDHEDGNSTLLAKERSNLRYLCYFFVVLNNLFFMILFDCFLFERFDLDFHLVYS